VAPGVTVKALNSQVAEQCNAALDRIRVQVGFLVHVSVAECGTAVCIGVVLMYQQLASVHAGCGVVLCGLDD
jgi:hypothetical protein